MLHTRGLAVVLVGWAALSAAVPVAAREIASDNESRAVVTWWNPGFDGDIVTDGYAGRIDDPDFGLMLYYQRTPRPWGFSVDATLVDGSSDFPAVGSVPPSISRDLTLGYIEGAAVRRWGERKRLKADLLFGVRLFWSETSFQPLFIFPGADGDATWVDGFVGGRLLVPIAEIWSFSLRVDMGAGGSDITNHALALFDVDLTQLVSLVVGYRYLQVEYDDDGGGGYGVDVDMAGPFIGAGFRW